MADRCEQVREAAEGGQRFVTTRRGKLVVYLILGSMATGDGAAGSEGQTGADAGSERRAGGNAGGGGGNESSRDICELVGPDSDVLVWRGPEEEMCGEEDCRSECQDVCVLNPWAAGSRSRHHNG